MTPRNPASATQDVRGAILAEATRLFEATGVDGMSMRQVASAIGYSATTIYLHFQDKNHLMYAVCESGFGEFGARLEAAVRGAEGTLDQLRAAGRAYVDFALEHPMHYDVMFMRPKAFDIAGLVAENPNYVGEEPASFLALVHVIGAGMDAGELRRGDPREVAAEVWSCLHGVVALAFSMNDQLAIFEPDVVRARAARVIDQYLSTLT